MTCLDHTLIDATSVGVTFEEVNVLGELTLRAEVVEEGKKFGIGKIGALVGIEAFPFLWMHLAQVGFQDSWSDLLRVVR